MPNEVESELLTSWRRGDQEAFVAKWVPDAQVVLVQFPVKMSGARREALLHDVCAGYAEWREVTDFSDAVPIRMIEVAFTVLADYAFHEQWIQFERAVSDLISDLAADFNARARRAVERKVVIDTQSEGDRLHLRWLLDFHEASADDKINDDTQWIIQQLEHSASLAAARIAGIYDVEVTVLPSEVSR